jgi:hypothetical protein
VNGIGAKLNTKFSSIHGPWLRQGLQWCAG